MKKISGLIALTVFSVALWLLFHELQHYHYHQIARAAHAIPNARIALALGLTLLNYLLLTGYDSLAFRYIGQRLSYREIGPASFFAYSISNNLGFSLFSGAAVRYHFYSACGVSAGNISRVVAFCSLTFWAGYTAISGTTFLLSSPPVDGLLQGHALWLRPLGALLLTLPAAYLILCRRHRGPVRFKRLEFALPEVSVAALQLLVGAADIVLTSLVLFVLLPPELHLSYPGFLATFNLALIAGLLSYVPGGLGVFETTVLLLLPSEAKNSAVVGALLAFRVIYYLLPLIAASASITGIELYSRRHTVGRVARQAGGVVSFLLPHFLAATTFLGGVVLLFSGATPTIHHRLIRLIQYLPLSVIEVSHFLSSLAGAALLILARGIQRRLDSAWQVSLALLLLGALWSLLKGLDYEEATLLLLFCLLLWSSRGQFFRKASLASERFTPGWIVLVCVTLAGVVWVGMFSYKHVEYSHDLWWHWALYGDASRSMRAALGAAVITVLFGLARLLQPTPASPRMPGAEELLRVRDIVDKSPDTRACLALLGDKSLLFSGSGQSFLMYGVSRRSWVALGGPVGRPEEARELVWNFREMSHLHGGWAVFYEVRPANLPLYLDLGLSLVKLGEEGLVPLEDFSVDGASHKSFRRYLNSVEREGGQFEIVPAGQVAQVLPELRAVSDSWLSLKHTGEKRFSLGFFDPRYLSLRPVAVVRREGRIVAFANLMYTDLKEELSVDLMRYGPEAPEGSMEYLFVRLMLWGREQGFERFNIGMAPLSGLEDRTLAPLWNQVGALLFHHGQHFYNFQGLRAYKEKFHPVWEPRYLATPGGLALPRVLTHLAELVGGDILRTLGRPAARRPGNGRPEDGSQA
ncbi:bifunctional lysylphosphatidylglycerol flippase/synthetase MprF [bacterium]|nr:bifunctional lysylphosphatidylglycerol flippase/synthetase MprF [bacterium]